MFLKKLIETAENPENIREAMESLKDMFEGETRLLAAYFLMKYPKSATDDGVKSECPIHTMESCQSRIPLSRTIDWMSKRGVYTPS